MILTTLQISYSFLLSACILCSHSQIIRYQSHLVVTGRCGFLGIASNLETASRGARVLRIRGGRRRKSKKVNDIGSTVRRKGEDYPPPGAPAPDKQEATTCDNDPILQRLQDMMFEIHPNTPEGRQMLSMEPIPRVLDSEGESMEAELLHQAPVVIMNATNCVECFAPSIVAHRLWEAAEVRYK